MTTENPELDEINRLLEVEKQASALIENAMTESDKIISDAHAKFNEQFKSQTEKLTEKLTQEYNDKLEEIKLNHQKEIEAFKLALEKKEINQSNFDSLLTKLLTESHTA